MISARGLSACLAVALVWVSVGANASAGIVFGNLGPTGAGGLSNTNTDLGTQSNVAVNWVAQGFNTGSTSQLYLTAVQLGLYATGSGTEPLTVSIFSSSSGVPGAALSTSAVTNVGGKGSYTFTFPSYHLQQNTEYFVVPNGGSWYWNSAETAPDGLNGSGYTYTSTKRSFAPTATPDGPWTNAATSVYSVSVSSSSAVPEIDPSGVASTLAVVAGAFSLLERRRVKVIVASFVG